MRFSPSVFPMHPLTPSVLVLSFSRSAHAEWRAQEGCVPLEGWLAPHLLSHRGRWKGLDLWPWS